jgi:hypothetical protein
MDIDVIIDLRGAASGYSHRYTALHIYIHVTLRYVAIPSRKRTETLPRSPLIPYVWQVELCLVYERPTWNQSENIGSWFTVLNVLGGSRVHILCGHFSL